MSTLILIIHVIVCFELIIVVLLQAGKGNGLGGLFGGGSQTIFGTQGATVITKITTASAIIFMVTSLLLTILTTKDNDSIVKQSGNIQMAAPTTQKAKPVKKKTTVQKKAKTANKKTEAKQPVKKTK